MRRPWMKSLFAVGWWISTIGLALPQDEAQSKTSDLAVEGYETLSEDPLSNWNLALPTMGGKQLWTDHRYWNGWRIQYNNTFGHWRLLDPKAVRRGWGTKQAMLDELSRIQQASPSTSTPAEEVVFLLHGLMRTTSSMKPLATEIRSRTTTPPEIIYFGYASTRDSVAAHASAFREVVENLPGRPRWKAMGHSMGNIVARHYIGDLQRTGKTEELMRIKSVVMLGPPNQGSSFARKLSQLGLFEIVTGTSGMQLGPQWSEFQSHLGVPTCPFAVIAGDISKHPIQNPWLQGPSDGIVTVDEARLDGMQEFIVHPVLHSFLMQDSRCVRDAIDFLMR